MNLRLSDKQEGGTVEEVKTCYDAHRETIEHSSAALLE
jgi:hypothetical protein